MALLARHNIACRVENLLSAYATYPLLVRTSYSQRQKMYIIRLLEVHTMTIFGCVL